MFICRLSSATAEMIWIHSKSFLPYTVSSFMLCSSSIVRQIALGPEYRHKGKLLAQIALQCYFKCGVRNCGLNLYPYK